MADTSIASPEEISRRARAGGRLILQRCTRCERAAFPPRLLCCDCGTQTLAFFEAAGVARIIAATRVAADNVSDGPRVIALAELTEGVTLMGNIKSDEDCFRLIGRAVRISLGDEGSVSDTILFEDSP